jgi:hypothetical protein
MTDVFPVELERIQASMGSPVDLQRLQNEVLQQALEESQSIQSQLLTRLEYLTMIIERRTAVLSPATGFTNEGYGSINNQRKYSGLNNRTY